MINKKYKIFISATEQSGDNIGYNIIAELFKTHKNLIIDGVGGNKMKPYFNDQFYSLKNFNAMGVIEIIFSIRNYIRMISNLIDKIFFNKYDLIITIDSPDFHYPLTKKLRKKNYNGNIIHIVAPSVWAWRKNRAKKFSNIYDEIFVLFDFEVDYFIKYNVKTTLIGHPIFYIKSNNYIPDKKYIAFLPGSRLSEIKKLFRFFNIAYEYLHKNNIKIKIFIPTVPHLTADIEHYVKNWKIDTIVTSDINLIEYFFPLCSNAVVCSGTASLEIAKRNIPQLVIYKLNYFTELLVKRFIKVKFANIINIIEKKIIIPEIVNSQLNDKTFIIEFKKLILDNNTNYEQINNVNKVLKKIQLKYPPYILAVKRIISYF